MPIPTRSAWYAHRAPLPLHQLALLVMFLIEIPLPFGVFVPGLPRLAAAAGIAALQLGIALTGNFGHFNVLTVVLCLPLLDNPCGVPTPEPPGAVDSALWYFFALFGGVSLVFNSWCARSWAFWPALSQHPNPAVAAIAEAFRVVCSWRLVHAYGVFPPHSSPPARFVPVFEGSADGGKTWLRYRYRYGPLNYRTAARTLFLRPYLAHFCPVFSRFFAVFSVLTPGFQKVAPKDRGPVP